MRRDDAIHSSRSGGRPGRTERTHGIGAEHGEAQPSEAQIKIASNKVKLIESLLRANDLLPVNEKELFDGVLDRLFPRAKSKEIVNYGGLRFQRRFYPVQKGAGNAVTEWEKAWVPVTD